MVLKAQWTRQNRELINWKMNEWEKSVLPTVQSDKRWTNTEKMIKDTGISSKSRKRKVLLAQSCPTLCGLMDCIPPGFSVCGILQARILGWVAMSSSRASSWSKEWTQVSCIAGRFYIIWATREAHKRSDIHIIGIPEEGRSGLETILDKIISKNFRNLMIASSQDSRCLKGP